MSKINMNTIKLSIHIYLLWNRMWCSHTTLWNLQFYDKNTGTSHISSQWATSEWLKPQAELKGKLQQITNYSTFT